MNDVAHGPLTYYLDLNLWKITNNFPSFFFFLQCFVKKKKSRMGSRLPPMPRISEIVKLYRLSATKKLSQNFLLDMNVCHKFVNCISVTKGSHICEVGPGPGGITRALLESDAEKVHVIEKDKRFLPPLEVSLDRT